MPITRSQHREIERKKREEIERNNAIRTAIEASRSRLPTTLDYIQLGMNNLNTNDDYSLNVSTKIKAYHHGRPLGREHTDPMEQPLNIDPVIKSDLKIPEFTAAKLQAYKIKRSENMYEPPNEAGCFTYSTTFNSSGESTTELSITRDPFRSLSLSSDIDEMKFRINSDESISVERRQSTSEGGSTVDQTDSSANEEYSIHDQSSPVP
ncbi:hypothetical protein INT46_008834 [Mucor plumbeus]|uniref:Uncharacterized protein n=1 Tax=Mucor plumbeus TaxID=97098 RepID=A0A8H7V7M5_9FUNG|nr:hypothetical protein INT46_008834 [Mucor plumbeus]